MNCKKIFKSEERGGNKGNMKIKKIKNLFINFTVLIFISIIISCANSVKVDASSTTNIMGQSQLTQEQALNYFRTRNNEKSDQTIKQFISIVWQEANIEGIRADVVFIQIMKETNFLKFTGDVKESQNNFAGIGATGNGACGAYFKDTKTGVRAVIQHLKAYSSTEELKNTCVDPRFTYVQRGITPYVEWLGIGENPNYPDKGWAADNNYGKSIVTMMNSAKYLSDSSEAEENTDISDKATIEKLDVNLNGNKIVNDDLKLGQVYKIKAYGSSSNGVLYEYWIKDLTKNLWTKIKDYSTSNEITWTPNKSGKYLIGVHVKDKNSKERLDNHKYEEYSVVSPKKATIDNIEVSLNGNKIVNNELQLGQVHKIKAYGTSSNGVLYEYWVKDLTKNLWIKIKDYSTSNEITWTANKSGKYLIGVHVKDKYSKERLDNHKYEEYSVVSPKKATIDNLEISLNDNKIVNNDLKTGEIYKIKAYGKSSNGVLYEYWIKDLSKNLWTKIKDYSTSNEITWIPNKSGKYLIGVHVKDKYSQERLDNHKYVEYNIKLSKKAVISNLEVSLNGQSIQNNELQSGKSYNIKAYAESLNGVLYEYWIKDLTENLWTKIGDYSSSNTATWTPNKSGKYLIGVHVKDKYSQEKLDNHKYEEYNVQGGLIKTIVLDAGHGGRDSGAVSSKATGSLHEADIVQKITIKLGNLLKSKGYNVIYTRDKVDNYNYPSVTQNLEDRINVANSIKADLFMSIHADSADSSSANGYGSHYSTYRPNLDNSGVYMQGDVWYDRTPCDAALKSKVLSQLIVNEMSSLGGSNRGIEDHNLYVTRNALMPSVLVETGFVSNDTEVRKLNSDSYQNQIAQKLYNAITKLFSM
ncbi:N-acetylmuramoyl-L-alanine amidase [Clostridium botulinum]|uniref:N-acetylmuramoyl-L-alanine amidase n=1 Tax=Clostridium botulinum TaxID=1491 RepID=UPI002237EAD0|nr:N-acetylmuramoyl-L-alanine amidase [Clostridium botulinum]MCW6097992.1 N-acetylmuramoyl-L-alanine amidase [Clostridium botulinum]